MRLCSGIALLFILAAMSPVSAQDTGGDSSLFTYTVPEDGSTVTVCSHFPYGSHCSPPVGPFRDRSTRRTVLGIGMLLAGGVLFGEGTDMLSVARFSEKRDPLLGSVGGGLLVVGGLLSTIWADAPVRFEVGTHRTIRFTKSIGW